MAILILDLPDREEEEVAGVLRDALECHVSGLKEATVAATQDRTLESPEELTLATGSMSEDINIAEALLEVIRDYSHQ
jgi:hypothetical protein